MYKLSIIIPVYNAEDCLDITINSIIKQSIGFENIELILVDDNSSDNSKNMLIEYSNKYKNILSFFSNENHGFPGYGRNVGISKSSSKYIMFVDNDDELDSQICENLYNAIIEYDADISCCDIVEIDNVSSEIHKMGINSDEKYVVAEGDEILNFNSGLIWNKLFKKDIIFSNRIKFLTDNYVDDQAFSIEFMLNSNKLVYVNNYVGYLWNRRDSSLSNSSELKDLLPLFKGYHYVVNLFLDKNKEYLIPVISNNGTGYLLLQSTLLESKKDRIYFLKKIYEFEEKCEFNVKLKFRFFAFVNFFVLRKNFLFASLLLSLYHKLTFSTILRKINRMIVNR